MKILLCFLVTITLARAGFLVKTAVLEGFKGHGGGLGHHLSRGIGGHFFEGHSGFGGFHRHKGEFGGGFGGHLGFGRRKGGFGGFGSYGHGGGYGHGGHFGGYGSDFGGKHKVFGIYGGYFKG